MSRASFTGKRAIVTGASGGIGSCIVRILSAEGVSVGLVARRLKPLEELQRSIGNSSRMVVAVPADVTDRSSLLEAIDTVRERWGGIDIAISCAGTYMRGPVVGSDPALHEDQWRTSYLGTLHLFSAVVPEMIERGWGRLGLVSSVDSLKGMPLESAYSSGKAAEAILAGILRQELHGTGVFLSTIYPSRTDTPMIETLEVPWVSRKIAPERVARALIRGMRKRKSRLITPALGPRLLLFTEIITPAFSDMVARLFRLSGWTAGENERL